MGDPLRSRLQRGATRSAFRGSLNLESWLMNDTIAPEVCIRVSPRRCLKLLLSHDANPEFHGVSAGGLTWIKRKERPTGRYAGTVTSATLKKDVDAFGIIEFTAEEWARVQSDAGQAINDLKYDDYVIVDDNYFSAGMSPLEVARHRGHHACAALLHITTLDESQAPWRSSITDILN